jgi:hypothetical protein
MNLTVVTGPKGQLVGLVRAHLSELNRNQDYSTGGPHATLVPGPGQKFHEIVAPAGHEKLPREELRRWVMKNIPRKKATKAKRKKK